MSLDNIRSSIELSELLTAPNADISQVGVFGSATPLGEVSGFAALQLNPSILKALIEAGYDTPTTVQMRAIPDALAGHDLMVSSKTGSGKTAAFMLPALHKLAEASKLKGVGPRMLVLTPTRELALQVSTAAEKYGKYMKRVKVVSILGGMPYPVQNRLLKQPVDVLVATPGRLLDHLQRGRIDFSRLELLVLDEADRMLDMGFIEDIETIVAATPATRQTLLFSATLDGTVARLAANMLRQPKRIEVTSQKEKHENIEQRLHFADDLSHKNRLLDHLLRDVAVNQALVFTATKRDADTLAETLSTKGFSVAALHGDMNQGQRTRTLNEVRRGSVKILVATDVAARGLDVQGISHVINFDLPRQAEDYVHRIGRTGRAGKSGVAISLAGGKDFGVVRDIERYTAQQIAVHVVPGLEPRFAGRAAPKKPPGAKRPGSARPGGYSNGKPSVERKFSKGPGFSRDSRAR